MDKKIISLLTCPYCGSIFRLKKVFQTFSQGAIRFGILGCDCDVFPIVEGILFLKKNDPLVLKNRQAVELLKQGQYQEAVNLLFEERKRAKIPYMLLLKGFFKPAALTDFLKVLKIFIPESRAWLEHLAERERRPTFFLSLANLAYVRRKQTVIDVGCSVGWFLNRAFSHQPSTTFIGIEASFSALYLSRKFILKNKANLICTDADLGLPFQSNTIDRIFANDTFMYLKRKKYFLEETRRIGTPHSLAFLSHVHSVQAENVGQGYGLTPRELAVYMQEHRLWAVPDQALFYSVIGLITHPYATVKKGSKILTEPSCSLVVSKDKHFAGRRTPVWVSRLLGRTTLNSIEDPQLKV